MRFSVNTLIGLLPFFSDDSISNKLLINLIKKSEDILFTFLLIKKIELGKEITLEGFVKSQSKGKYHSGFETVVNRIKFVEEDK